MTPENSISREDFASPEAIERNYQRLARIGDRGQTGNLFAATGYGIAATGAEPAADPFGEIIAEAETKFAQGGDLPLFSS